MVLVLYLIIINIVAFIFYGVDKKKAEKHQRRISEASLILYAVFGGAFGAFIGMFVWHHKTRKPKFRIMIPVLTLLWMAICAFCLYQNYHLVVTRFEYTNEKVTSENDGFKIVQVSDLHCQLFGINQKTLLEKIEAEDPDIIVVTGDAVDFTHPIYPFTEQFFEGALKIAPVYYIDGNHETNINTKRFSKYLKKLHNMGVQFIDNLKVDLDGIELAGAEERSLGSVDRLGLFEDDQKLHILLAHEPRYVDTYERAGADVVLSGHIHGGQIIIPGKGGFISPDIEFFPKYYAGEYNVGDTTMFVSRGLGNSILPVRINNYPEIVVVTLHSKQ